jgi:hypothetical protein
VANFSPVLPPEVPVGNPAYAAVSAADTISPVDPDALYLAIVKGGSGADTVVFDDPTSQVAPAGAVTPGNPDMSHSVPATTGDRHFLLRSRRHRDAAGVINVTHSAPTGVTMIVYGPFRFQ